MIKILKQLHNGESKIELVQLGQEKLILRTAKLEDVCNEKMFIEELQKNNIKTLKYFERDFLKEDQLLIEYINGSPLIEDSLTSENIYKWGVLCKKIHQIKYDKIFKLLADNRFFKMMDGKYFLTKVLDILLIVLYRIPKKYFHYSN